MNLLAAGFGPKKISLAISEGILADALPELTYTTKAEALQKLVQICGANNVKKVVFGSSKSAADFAEEFAAIANGVEIIFVEQEATTKTKGKVRKSTTKVEPQKAVKILESYLENQ